MSLRRVILLIIAASCLTWGGWRISKTFFGGNERVNDGLPPELRRVWKCRADGYVTNLTVAELFAQFDAGKTRPNPAYPGEELLQCPKCEKTTLAEVVISVEEVESSK